MNNKKPQIKELLKVKVFQIAYIVYSMSIVLLTHVATLLHGGSIIVIIIILITE